MFSCSAIICYVSTSTPTTSSIQAAREAYAALPEREKRALAAEARLAALSVSPRCVFVSFSSILISFHRLLFIPVCCSSSGCSFRVSRRQTVLAQLCGGSQSQIPIDSLVFHKFLWVLTFLSLILCSQSYNLSYFHVL